ncbi:DUF362 domain-containing protein [Patescibacteria group bacterium]
MVTKIEVEKNLEKAVKSAVDELGGFGMFVTEGDVVLLKPNFNTADPYPASTSMDFLSAVTKLCYEQKVKTVIIAESCTMTQNTRRVMETLGVFELEKDLEPCPRILVLEERDWVKKEIPNAKYLKHVTIPKLLEKVDKHILLPCLKTHFQAEYTGALKLGVAYMKPWERIHLHMSNIEEKIAELNSLYNVDLVIMDARQCFIADGPTKGPTAEPGLILASDSRVEIDIEGIKTIQGFKGNSLKNFEAEDLPQIARAREIGIK